MITAKKEDRLHEFQLIKLLTGVCDNEVLAQKLFFKGGTCAALAGYLDRFSVDLDFDLSPKANKAKVRGELEKVFKGLDFTIENNNQKTLYFTLKYKSPGIQRNTLKLSVFEEIVESNDYKPIYLAQIERLVNCQVIETMFANKLVTPVDRYQKHKKVAGRDIYDIYYFFFQGYDFKKEIIEERTGLNTSDYLDKLISFIEERVTEDILTRDLNLLLPYEKFKIIRKTLKNDVLMLLKGFGRSGQN